MIIYKTTNLVNGKIYVGQDSNNNDNYFGSGLLIKRAISKHGVKNFKKEILEVCSTKLELNNKEIYWIEKLNATDVRIGYNITNGGDGGLTSNKENIIKKVTELWLNEEYRSKQMKSRENRIYRQVGEYNHSNETKEKLRVAHKGKKQSDEHKLKTKKFNLEKRVYSIIKCVETGEVFKSINDAKRWLGKGDIQSCLSGRQKTAGGYHWLRLSEVKKK